MITITIELADLPPVVAVVAVVAGEAVSVELGRGYTPDALSDALTPVLTRVINLALTRVDA